MSNKSVFCLVTTKLQADQIVNRLQSSGYPYEDISVHTDTADEVRVAKEILEAEGAEDIGVSGEASVPEDAKRSSSGASGARYPEVR